MATFAEYPAPTMASSNDNDFTLYPYQDWNDQTAYLPPSSTYADPSFINSTTFESYPSHTSYAPQAEFDFTGFQSSVEQSKSNGIHAPSPSYSPAQSASHLDYQSGASVQSTISSAMGSPSAQPHTSDWSQQHIFPGIVPQADGVFASNGIDYDLMPVLDKACVDPSLIQPFSPSQPQYNACHFNFSPPPSMPHAQMPSPAPSRTSIHSPGLASGHASPYMHPQSWAAPVYQMQRRPSISSVHSRHSSQSQSSEDSNKGQCPIATCGRHVKDLKAHMLTHQNERPEKCPIPTCEYHVKGFARKYDKNRHTLTHYKGTMVCGFCPGSGSAAEKSFNRADVFKRHLTSVHGVEQTPPNARKRSPATGSKRPFGSREVSGMCSTCGNTFASAQDFYEHLDDCVLRVVQQADPSEAINEKLLAPMSADNQVQQTMDKHMLPVSVDYNAPTTFDDEEVDEDEDADEDDSSYGARQPNKSAAKARREGHVAPNGAICKPTGARKGLTHSKGGVPLAGSAAVSGKGSKRRKNYPISWGTTPEKMKMKKRTLCVFDGQRSLWKDEMMLAAEHEVRIPLPGIGDRRWVTDLDVQTLKRAEGVLNATDEEKGPWSREDEGDELERLMK